MTENDNTTPPADTVKDFNRGVVEEFRATGGKVGGPFEGETLLLLHSTGAKSGQPRISPVAYLMIEDKMLIRGSHSGAPNNPAWVHNLRADPHAHIEVGTDSYDVLARELLDAERDEFYPKVAARAPVVADYQAKTARTIPLFELIRGLSQ